MTATNNNQRTTKYSAYLPTKGLASASCSTLHASWFKEPQLPSDKEVPTEKLLSSTKGFQGIPRRELWTEMASHCTLDFVAELASGLSPADFLTLTSMHNNMASVAWNALRSLASHRFSFADKNLSARSLECQELSQDNPWQYLKWNVTLHPAPSMFPYFLREFDRENMGKLME